MYEHLRALFIASPSFMSIWHPKHTMIPISALPRMVQYISEYSVDWNWASVAIPLDFLPCGNRAFLQDASYGVRSKIFEAMSHMRPISRVRGGRGGRRR